MSALGDYPLRLYVLEDGDLFGPDGYPYAWHLEVKGLVREQAGHRCVRCQHPFVTKGDARRLCLEASPGEWSPCDERCTHQGPIRYRFADEDWCDVGTLASYGWNDPSARERLADAQVEAQWRVLTVHHLDGNKANCRWWNLVALCQRCHLLIQGKVILDRPWPWPHTDWMRPYVAGFYALKYLAEELPIRPSEDRIAELLELGAREESVERLAV